MRYRKFAEVGGRLEIDGHRAVPCAMPIFVSRIVGDGFVDAGIVHKHVDLAAELGECCIPNVSRRPRIEKVAGDEFVCALRGMADHPMAAALEECVGGRSNAAARARNEDVHAPDYRRVGGGGRTQAAMPFTNALAVDLKFEICSLK